MRKACLPLSIQKFKNLKFTFQLYFNRYPFSKKILVLIAFFCIFSIIIHRDFLYLTIFLDKWISMLKKILVILLFAGTATHCPAQPIHTDYVFSKKELNGAKNLVNHFIQHGYSPKEIATLIAQSTIQEDTLKLVAPSKISKDVIICFAIGAGVGVAAMALIYGTLYTGACLKEQKAIEVADKKTESAGDIQKQLKEQEDQNQKTKESEQSSEEKNKLEVEEKQTNEKLEQQESLHKIEEEKTQQSAKDQEIARLIIKEAEEKEEDERRIKEEIEKEAKLKQEALEKLRKAEEHRIKEKQKEESKLKEEAKRKRSTISKLKKNIEKLKTNNQKLSRERPKKNRGDSKSEQMRKQNRIKEIDAQVEKNKKNIQQLEADLKKLTEPA